MVRVKSTLALCPSLLLMLAGGPVLAQARYDDHESDERLRILVGGFRTQDLSSELRVDSRHYGIGTALDFEDQLNLERSVTVARLDGFYRFDRAHRVEWTFFSQERGGLKAVLDDEVSIGDVVIPATYSIDSALKIRLEKVNYAWSFINTEPYEFFLGAGLNVRHVSLAIRGTGSIGGEDDPRIFESADSVPLPTVTAGMRYNIGQKLRLGFRLESFFIRAGEDTGRWNDAYLLLDYNVTKHFGFGGGVNTSTMNLKASLDDDLSASLESSHTGLLLYFTTGF